MKNISKYLHYPRGWFVYLIADNLLSFNLRTRLQYHSVSSYSKICKYYMICFSIDSCYDNSTRYRMGRRDKKKARGTNDDDLGEFQDIGQTYIVTQKGTISKEKFYLPKYLVEGYDGDVLRFRISREEAGFLDRQIDNPNPLRPINPGIEFGVFRGMI